MQTSPVPQEEDLGFERTLRPKLLKDYIGQQKIKEQLGVFMEAARRRGEPLDHVLLCGPPGLGKTTLATIVANEMGAPIHSTSGPALEKTGDAAAMLTGLQPGDVLFVDEIHRLHPSIEEALYSALEDFRFDIVVGEAASGRSVKLKLSPFTFVGATTRAGMMTSPLRDRFGIVLRLDYYTAEEMVEIVRRSAALLGISGGEGGLEEIAARSRSTPRIANRLLRRVRDYAEVRADGAKVGRQVAADALEMMDVDAAGLDTGDKKYLEILIQRFGGGPVGIDTLSVALGDEVDTIESFIEPFLMKEGLIQRTSRGRVATPHAWRHVGLPAPSAQGGLWNDA